jgi:hypothetical protein
MNKSPGDEEASKDPAARQPGQPWLYSTVNILPTHVVKGLSHETDIFEGL